MLVTSAHVPATPPSPTRVFTRVVCGSICVICQCRVLDAGECGYCNVCVCVSY